MQKGLASLNRCIFLRSLIGFSLRVVAMRQMQIINKIAPVSLTLRLKYDHVYPEKHKNASPSRSLGEQAAAS
jgi:hypothetical protein